MKKTLFFYLLIFQFYNGECQKISIGTSILMNSIHDTIWIAADTRCINVINKDSIFTTKSKIYKSGNIYYAFANCVAAPPLYDANKALGEIIKKGNNFYKSTLIFNKYMLNISNKLIDLLKSQNQLEYFNNHEKPLLIMLTATFLNKKPKYIGSSFYIRTINGRDTLIIEPTNITYPGHFFMGYHDHIDSFIKRGNYNFTSIYSALYSLIDIESKHHKEVSKPIDVILITSKGHKWVTAIRKDLNFF